MEREEEMEVSEAMGCKVNGSFTELVLELNDKNDVGDGGFD